MLSKTKIESKFDNFSKTFGQAGLFLMAAAATLGILQLPSNGKSRVVVNAQPSFVLASNKYDSLQNNSLRRESDEATSYYVSYSEVQRTPSRTRGI